MTKFINKKLLIVKLLYMLSGAIFLIIISFLSKLQIIYSNSYVINTVITSIIISITVFVIIIYNKMRTPEVHIADLVLSFILPFILLVIYRIPVFGFLGQKGVNNSIMIVYFFSLYAFFVYDLSLMIGKRYRNSQKKIGNSATGKFYFHKIIKYFATCIVILALIFAIINIFIPKFDFSDLF